MIRKIIKIDEEKCNGCALCVDACHEMAIVIVNEKAKLLRDDYCDGLGDCLPSCPMDAISFEMREADAYDEKAVQENVNKSNSCCTVGFSCSGTQLNNLEKKSQPTLKDGEFISQLNHWPIQIKLVPINAPYFNDANLLIAADCTAYAYGDFHNRFIKDKVVLIGCPKLDDGDYADKLTEIIKNNNIKSVTIVRMEVPCCIGLENAVKRALQASGKFIQWQIIPISVHGEILS